MALNHPVFRANERIRNAATNAPAMRRGETDAEAVRILQQALFSQGAHRFAQGRTSAGFDGAYTAETVAAVENFQRGAGRRGHFCELDGVAGKQTWRALDALTPNPIPDAAVTLTSGETIPPAETPETVGGGGALAKPSAADMLAAYRNFRRGATGMRVPGRPCNAGHEAGDARSGITNQCAVRMSIALGMTVTGFTMTNADAEFTHRAGKARCGLPEHLDYPHNAGAERLFGYLEGLWTWTRYRRTGRSRQSGDEIFAAVRGRKGLIYFRDVFVRSADRRRAERAGTAVRKKGDHIDYFDGAMVMNDRLAYNAADERGEGDNVNSERWFEGSRDIYFCPLPD